MWKGNLEEASKCLDGVEEGGELARAGLRVELALWQLNFVSRSDEAEAAVSVAIADLWGMIAVGIEGVDGYPHKVMAILASVADAALHGRKGTIVALGKAGFALKAAFSAATVASDAYGGLTDDERATPLVQLAHELFCYARGLLALAASMIPPSLSWLTQMIGVKGSRAEARSLFSSMPRDSPKAVECRLLLLLMDMVWGEPDEASADRVLPAMRAINEEYCGGVSPLVWSATGGAARYLGSWQEALDAYRAAVTHGEAAGLTEFVITQHYWLGQIAWFRGDFDAALKYCSQFTEETSGVNFKPYAGYIVASVLLMRGDAAGARVWFSKVVEWARPNQSYDAFAKRQAQKFLAGDFDDFDAVWLRAYAAHEGKDYQRAMNELAKCVPMLKTCKERRNRYALFYWLKGSCLRTSPAKQDKARAHMEQAVQQEEFMDTDLFAVAYARVELGEMALESGDLQQADELFCKAKAMSGYDWEKLLTSRIGRGLDKVAEAKAAAKASSERVSENAPFPPQPLTSPPSLIYVRTSLFRPGPSPVALDAYGDPLDGDSMAELSSAEVAQRLGSISNGDEVKEFVQEVRQLYDGIDSLASQLVQETMDLPLPAAVPTKRRVRRRRGGPKQEPYQRALEAWVKEHLHHPVPTKAETSRVSAHLYTASALVRQRKKAAGASAAQS
eukprot:CAMPEP_0170752330 /NCGR_PEP_ID=MMETSP0437-20130122/11912_1 /TAXON_ID=0 /ORGANISM="Sexangularia sp." /LENGTH=674 /DNA_ID=CAMNT_0011091395 /DNA_START=32 /DNA_END=2058 /DNA_ORIENTATION=+